MAVSYKNLEAAHRQRYEEKRPVQEGRYQPGIRYQDGPERPCHNRNTSENLYRAGLPG